MFILLGDAGAGEDLGDEFKEVESESMMSTCPIYKKEKNEVSVQFCCQCDKCWDRIFNTLVSTRICFKPETPVKAIDTMFDGGNLIKSFSITIGKCPTYIYDKYSVRTKYCGECEECQRSEAWYSTLPVVSNVSHMGYNKLIGISSQIEQEITDCNASLKKSN